MTGRNVTMRGQEGQPLKISDGGYLFAVGPKEELLVEGKLFARNLNDDSLGAGNRNRFRIITPVDTYVYLVLAAWTGALGKVDLWEGPNVTVAGTPEALYNANRTSSNTPDVQLEEGPTTVGNGTQIMEETFSGPMPPRVFLLERDEDYLLRIQNNDAAAQPACLSVLFAEDAIAAPGPA